MNGRFLLFLFIFIFDQLTKYWADSTLILNQPEKVIEGIFNFTLVYNKGAAFGMFSGLADPWRHIALWGVSAIALLVVLRFMYREAKDDLISRYCLSAILAGAFGNISDRYRLDYVIDFLDFYHNNYHWPAFNIADSAISVGVVLLMFRSFVQRKI